MSGGGAGRPAGRARVTVTAWALLAVTARRRDRWSVVWWALAAALAAMATVRAAGWIVWPCLVAAVALGSLAAAGGAGWRQVAVGLVPRPALVVLRAPRPGLASRCSAARC